MNSKYVHHIYAVRSMPFKYLNPTPDSKMNFSVYHWHEQLELLYFHNDAARVRCSGIVYSPLKGDLVIVNSNELHDISDALGMSHECLIVDLSFLNENGISTDGLRLSNYVHQDKEVAELMQQIVSAYKQEDSLKIPRIRARILTLMVYLFEHYVSEEITESVDRTAENIMKAVRYVHRHFSEPISLDDAAAAADLSRYYFSHKFRAVVGQNFVPFLNAVRCEKATAMLLDGMSVTEVSYACGFCEISQFSRTYQKIVGKKPSSLRKIGEKHAKKLSPGVTGG